MKTILSHLVAVIVIAAAATPAATQEFYYDADTTYAITVSNTRVTVQIDTTYFGFDAGQFVGWHPCLSTSLAPEDLGRNCLTFNLADGCSYASATPDLLADPAVLRVLPVYDFPDGNTDFSVTDLVSVQFDETLPVSTCGDLAASFGLHRVDSSRFRHNYWWCALDDSIKGSPMQYGNSLHVLPDVEWASATMYQKFELQSEPEDPYYQFQYYLRNTGQTGGTVDADIDADLAWNVTTGGVKVAILDNGWATHPDLLSPRVQGVWDFGDWQPEGGLPLGEPDARPGTLRNHGMACAGIIGASHDGIGVAGICPDCGIVGIKIAPDTANYFKEPRALANAIYLAYALGANVISNSWTGFTTSVNTDIANAIRYVTNNCGDSHGWHGAAAVIFSAGNNANKLIGTPLVPFPANMKETISAGAIDKNNLRWAYSCYGDNLDVVTPTGQEAIAGIPAGDVWTDDQAGDLGWNPLITGAGDANGDVDYTSQMGGTSASCAMVAGITALLLSRRPDLLDGCAPYETLRDVLTKSAVDLGDPGKDPLYGAGRANAYRALLAVIRGDVNNDGVIDALDLNGLIDMIFFGGGATLDRRTADVDCDGFADANDLNDLIDYLFFDGTAPVLCYEY